MAKNMNLGKIPLDEIGGRLEELKTVGMKWGGKGFLTPGMKNVVIEQLEQSASRASFRIIFSCSKKTMQLSQWAYNTEIMLTLDVVDDNAVASWYAKRGGSFGCMGCFLGCMDPAFLFSMFMGGNVKSIDSKFGAFMNQRFTNHG